MTSAATGDTTASVAVVSVSGFPSTVPYTLILGPDTSKEEVVTVTAASSTTLTITRGQDNTQAQSHAAGSTVRHGVSAREFKELQTHISARGYDTDSAILSGVDTHVHGISTGEGDVVGTAKAQTLSNKTFSGSFTASAATFVSPTITSPTISGTPVITGLTSVSLATSQATPKSYVDGILVLQTASQTAAATSATSAAASATAAATSATSAAASATAAATSATSAAASATTAAASVATIAGYSTTASASASAAATSATSAAASVTSAAASATAAATSATSAAASATAAATSATSAAASATAAATSATSAGTSATASASSASASATSASSAATSASSAATSASDAATTYDNFDDRYLGAKTSAPTLDNDGNALLTGALYFNSSTGVMAVWSGSAWVAINLSSSYSAPTLGSQIIASGTTYTNIAGLTINSTTIPTSKTLVATDSTAYVVPSQTSNSGKYLTTDGTTSSWGTVASYSAPTLGSTSIASGATVTTINGLTKIVSATHASLDANSYEQDIVLMTLMGAWI
jgi:hypothetical protein